MSEEQQGVMLAGRLVAIGETVLYDAHHHNPGEWGRQLYRARLLSAQGDTCRVRLDTGQEREVPVVFLSAYSPEAVARGARIVPVP